MIFYAILGALAIRFLTNANQYRDQYFKLFKKKKSEKNAAWRVFSHVFLNQDNLIVLMGSVASAVVVYLVFSHSTPPGIPGAFYLGASAPPVLGKILKSILSPDADESALPEERRSRSGRKAKAAGAIDPKSGRYDRNPEPKSNPSSKPESGVSNA